MRCARAARARGQPTDSAAREHGTGARQSQEPPERRCNQLNHRPSSDFTNGNDVPGNKLGALRVIAVLLLGDTKREDGHPKKDWKQGERAKNPLIASSTLALLVLHLPKLTRETGRREETRWWRNDESGGGGGSGNREVGRELMSGSFVPSRFILSLSQSFRSRPLVLAAAASTSGNQRQNGVLGRFQQLPRSLDRQTSGPDATNTLIKSITVAPSTKKKKGKKK